MRLGDYADGGVDVHRDVRHPRSSGTREPRRGTDPSTHPSPHAFGSNRDLPSPSGLPPPNRGDRPRRPLVHARVCRRDDLTGLRGTPRSTTTRKTTGGPSRAMTRPAARRRLGAAHRSWVAAHWHRRRWRRPPPVGPAHLVVTPRDKGWNQTIRRVRRSQKKLRGKFAHNSLSLSL